jgi:hypothetical protein
MQHLLDGTTLARLNADVMAMLSSFIMSWIQGIGTGLLGVILTIRFAARGRDMTLGLASSNPAAALVSIMMPYLAVTAAMTFWQVPVPGAGMSWPGMLTRSVDYVVQQISTLGAQDMLKTLDAMRLNMPLPFASVSEWIYWLFIQAFMMGLEIIALLVSSLAVILTGVCIMVGPLVMPCFLTQSMDWLATGWLRATVMLSTLPITLALIESVVGKYVVNQLLDMSAGGVLDFVNDFAAIALYCLLGILAVVVGTFAHNAICSGGMHVGGGALAPLLAKLRINL